MQLASKMRFLAAQFDALLTDDLWLRCAGHANAMAARLAGALADVPGLTITRPVETNAVFAMLPPAVTESLQRDFPFYVWDEAADEVRWMCSWDTTEDDVDQFAAAVRDALDLAGHAAVLDPADAVDLDHDHVAVLQEQLGLAAIADAARGAGQDQIARLERGELGDHADQRRHVEDQQLGRGLLDLLAVDERAERERRRGSRRG